MSNKKKILIFALVLALFNSSVNFSHANKLNEIRNNKSKLQDNLRDIQNKIEKDKNDINSYENNIKDSESKKEEVGVELEDIKNKKNNVSEKIKELSAVIQSTFYKIYETETSINNIQKEINEKNIEIEKTKNSLEFNNELLKKRIKAMYKLGEVSKIQIILNATDINDFLSRTTMMTTLTDSDQKLIENLRKYKNQLAELKTSLEENNKKLVSTKNELEESKKLLESQKAYNDELFSQLTEEEKSKDETLSKISDDIKEYENYLFTKKDETSSLNDEENKLKKEIAKLEADIIAEERRIELEKEAKAKAEKEVKVKAEKNSKEKELSSKRKELKKVTNKVAKVTKTRLQWPTDATYISSPFGWRIRPIYGGWGFHNGIDIAGPINTNIYSAEDGVVESVRHMYGDYGNVLLIDHGNGVKTLYAHLNSFLVSKGQRVKRGQHIAEMGTTGYSTGSHLHFEARINGKRVDPLPYIKY